MMRRLSSFKSAPKSLVENISFDPEFCGYENGGAVFPEDENEEEDEIDAVDNVIPYVAPAVDLNTTLQGGVTSDNELNDSDDAEEVGESSSSDSECETTSPTQQKKGLRRFFCMPMRSMKAMKSLRISKKTPQTQQKGLLADE